MSAMYEFEWDVQKARTNQEKHGVSFEEAALAFGDDDYQVKPDDLHSEGEDRFIIMGMSPYGRLLTIAYTLRGEDTVRIISARHATSRERRTYEEKKRS
jgi:uncharacterized DUF497 family protein